MFSLINRGQYAQAIESEFENLFARLRGLLSQTFDVDGNLIVADPNLAVFAVGDVKPSFRPTSHTQAGWLLCDGSQVSRVTYASLFAEIGTTHGAGDGSTTFNLPDMRGRFPLGVAGSGTGSTLGATGGSIDHTHTGGSHTHTFSTTSGANGGFSTNTSAAGGHDHGGATSGPTSTAGITTAAGGTFFALDNHVHGIDSVSDHNHGVSVGDHSHTVAGTTDSASGTTGAANPPFNAVNFYIFAGI